MSPTDVRTDRQTDRRTDKVPTNLVGRGYNYYPIEYRFHIGEMLPQHSICHIIYHFLYERDLKNFRITPIPARPASFSALMTPINGNPPITGGSPHKGSVMRSFGAFYIISLR